MLKQLGWRLSKIMDPYYEVESNVLSRAVFYSSLFLLIIGMIKLFNPLISSNAFLAILGVTACFFIAGSLAAPFGTLYYVGTTRREDIEAVLDELGE